MKSSPIIIKLGDDLKVGYNRHYEQCVKGDKMPETSKDMARENIDALIAKFKDDKQRKTYNEQKTREYYVLPLFRALGWDTESPAEFKGCDMGGTDWFWPLDGF